MKFSHRSYEKELLDRDDIPFEDIRQNMKELDFINKYLGGHKITTEGFEAVLKKIKNLGKQTVTVCEIGCGGGDNLRVLKRFSDKNNIRAEFSGLDLNPHCIEFAASRSENKGIHFFTSDYRLAHFSKKPDIIFCSLFCHHFTDQEVVDIVGWLKKNTTVGFFINDLHRHPLAYYSIKYLTRLFSKSYLVKNDACLSVRRGFKRKELVNFIDKASASGCQVKWKWAFRWLVICSHE